MYSHTTTLLSNVCAICMYVVPLSVLSIIYVKKKKWGDVQKNSKSRHVFLNTRFDNHPTDGRLPMHLDVSDGQGVSFLPVTNHSMHDHHLPCFEINFPSRRPTCWAYFCHCCISFSVSTCCPVGHWHLLIFVYLFVTLFENSLKI